LLKPLPNGFSHLTQLVCVNHFTERRGNWLCSASILQNAAGYFVLQTAVEISVVDDLTLFGAKMKSANRTGMMISNQ
jgi:hypothetical protein